VEAVAHQAATDYQAPIRLDPWQAIGLAQRLRMRGVAVTEWTVALGLAALALTERTEGRGSITVPRSAPVERTIHNDHPSLPSRLSVRAAAEAGPRGLRAIIVPGSGNDPERGRRPW
jgi:hypothetical protein